MQTVTVTREIEAPPSDVEVAIGEVKPFMEAGGYDGVTVDGDAVTLENAVSLATIQLDLELVDEPDAALAYVQRDGIFREMETTFRVEESDGGSVVTGRTEFGLKGGPVGSILDATVIKRQRRNEMRRHMDYLEETTRTTRAAGDP